MKILSHFKKWGRITIGYFHRDGNNLGHSNVCQKPIGSEGQRQGLDFHQLAAFRATD